MEERPRWPRETPAPGRQGNLVATSSGWGFLLCAAVAIGYGLWTLYGSGTRVVILDATAQVSGAPSGALGPISLDPRMNPMRAVLRSAYAPMGSTRIRYEVELLDAAGVRLLEAHGAFGSSDDDASIVRTTTSLGDFRLARPGACFVRVRMADGSMDDLREATLELRRNVARVDPRIPWGFGLAAIVCLVVNLVVSRRRPWPYRAEENERPTAA
jgi:hypothetical protein